MGKEGPASSPCLTGTAAGGQNPTNPKPGVRTTPWACLVPLHSCWLGHSWLRGQPDTLMALGTHR